METRSAENLSRQLKETKVSCKLPRCLSGTCDLFQSDYEHLQDQLKNQTKAKEFLERSSTSFSEQLKVGWAQCSFQALL